MEVELAVTAAAVAVTVSAAVAVAVMGRMGASVEARLHTCTVAILSLKN